MPDNKARDQEMTECQGSAACENAVIDKYKKINAEQHESVVGCKSAQDCVNKANEVGQLLADYNNRANELLEKARDGGGLSSAEQFELSILRGTVVQLEADQIVAILNAIISGDSPEAKQLAINSLVQTAGMSAAGIAAGGWESWRRKRKCFTDPISYNCVKWFRLCFQSKAYSRPGWI